MLTRRILPLLVLVLASNTGVAGELKGRVLSADRPAAAVTVSAFPYESPLEFARRLAKGGEAPKAAVSVKTGPDGAFSLVLPAEPVGGTKETRRFEVRLEGEKLVSAAVDGLYEAGESEDLGDLVLSKGRKLAGKVVDAAGTGVADADVTLLPSVDPREETGDLRPTLRRFKTGADGTFQAEGAGPSFNTLIVRKAGFAAHMSTGVKAGALARPVVLAKETPLLGSVLRTDRRGPAAGALVRFEGKAYSSWAEVKEDGSFVLADAPAGKGTLVVDGGDAGYVEVSAVTVPAPADKKLVAVLAPPSALEGRAVDAKSGKAIPRVKVEVKAGISVRLVRTGPDGRYRLRPLPPGHFRLRADEPRYVPYLKEDVHVLAGESKKVDLPLHLGATMSGRVVDENGTPIAGAKGSLARGGETGMRAFFRRMRRSEPAAFRTAKDGTFRATRLQPGENQRLDVEHADYETATLGGVALAPGGTTAGVSIVMKRGATIAGLVHDKDGNPIPRVEIELTSEMAAGGRGGAMLALAGMAGRGKVETGADGRFAAKGLAPGDYNLTFTKSGWAKEYAEAVKVVEGKPADFLEVTLVPGVSIAGKVTTKGGSGVEGFMVLAGTPGRGTMGRGSPRPDAPTGPDGFFTVDGLKAGETYDLQLISSTGLGPQKKGIVAPADGLEIVVKGNGRIRGVVLDGGSGQPLTDFQVKYEAPPRRGGMSFRFAGRGGRAGFGADNGDVHADDGSFVLEDVPAGTWDVVVEAKGYQTARASGIVVEEGATKDGVEVKATKGSLLKGRVTDAGNARPVPDASVTVGSVGGGGGMGPMFAGPGGDESIVTDADGRFEVEGLAPGKLHLSVRHPDYTEASENVELKEGGSNVELKLATGGVLAGTVFGANRQALPGAQVSLEAAGEGGFGRFGGGTGATSDASGRFRFDHLGAGRYTVIASLRTNSSPPADVVLQAGESKEDVTLTLAAGTTVKGVVSGLPDAQRGGVSVWASGPESYGASTRTSDDGRFEIAGVPSGAVVLRATAGNLVAGSSRSATKELTIVDGQTEVEAEIVFENGYTLSGRVTKRGDPVGNALVFASVTGGGGRSSSARADEGGSYRLEGLAAGTYSVNAVAGDSSGGSKRETVSLAGDQTLDLVIPSARLGGTVVEAGSKQPLADATVEVSAADGPGPFQRAITSDASGRFLVENLDARSYTLTVRKPDFQFEKRTAAAAEQGADDLVVELSRGEGIGIQARDGVYGVPLRGLMARVTDDAKTPVFTGSVSLDSEGRGEIPSLKPGRYTVSVDASGYAPQTLPGVSVPSPTVPLALTPGGTLEIHVGSETLAKGGAQGRLLTAAGLPYAYSIFAPEGTIVLGTPVRRLPNVAPGSYTLAVNGAAAKAFNVTEGGTTMVELP